MADNTNSNKKTTNTPKPKAKKPTVKGPNQRFRQRTGVLIILILVLGFGAVLFRLSFLTLVQGSELQEKAVEQQLTDTVLQAKRGSIYDSNGNVIAESASVWQVVLAPANFKTDEQRQAAAKGLSEILGLDYENVLEKTKGDSYYVVVKRKVESDVRAKILELMDKLSEDYGAANVIQLLDDYKRYYPNNSLAACVIGFTGSDEQGLEGVEYKYNSYLSGTPGRIVTATNAQGNNMPFQYEQNVASEDGKNIYLTIDKNIQSICEKYMEQGVADNNVLNKGVCIAMDVNTGAILAMVTTGGFDLNDPYELPQATQAKIKAMSEKEQEKAESEALAAMWRNKAVSDTYIPGSVFKMCTASMAIEENVLAENQSFTCGGSITVADSTLGCSNRSGHGTQTFLQALCNSCNPAFVQIAQIVGSAKFREYFQGFGFMDKTGIDLPGEANGDFWAENKFTAVDLAVSSFGQNFQITPIQMVTAAAACANGGYVVQPHVVSKITDSKGNVVKSIEKSVKRQVISNETSKKISEMLGYNSETAGSTAGKVTGYKVAGKTGTSEKKNVVEKQSTFDEDYIASFCGYAPYDDPQIAMLVFFDTPSGSAYYGSQVSSPVFINIMSEVLPYLEVKTSYSDDEKAYVDVSAGDYTGLSISDAKQAVETDGFTYTVKGDGDKVISQIPTVSSKISTGGNIVLYTDTSSQSETVTVPNLIGYSASEVNSIAGSYGLNVSFSGSASSGGGLSTAQDIAENQKVSPGTVITVSFTGSSGTGVAD